MIKAFSWHLDVKPEVQCTPEDLHFANDSWLNIDYRNVCLKTRHPGTLNIPKLLWFIIRSLPPYSGIKWLIGALFSEPHDFIRAIALPAETPNSLRPPPGRSRGAFRGARAYCFRGTC